MYTPEEARKIRDPIEEVRQMLRTSIIEETVEAYRKQYIVDHGKEPPSKALITFRRLVESNPLIQEQIDRQVDDMLQSISRFNDKNTIRSVFGNSILIAFGISGLGSVVFFFLTKHIFLATTIFIACLVAGLIFIFWPMITDFFKKY